MLLNKFATGIYKKVCPTAPKISENLKNILGADGWREPNIFPMTAQAIIQ